jgi:hypothetical protein
MQMHLMIPESSARMGGGSGISPLSCDNDVFSDDDDVDMMLARDEGSVLLDWVVWLLVLPLAFLFTPATLGLLLAVDVVLLLSMLMTVVTVVSPCPCPCAPSPPSSKAAMSRSRLLGMAVIWMDGNSNNGDVYLVCCKG